MQTEMSNELPASFKVGVSHSPSGIAKRGQETANKDGKIRTCINDVLPPASTGMYIISRISLGMLPKRPNGVLNADSTFTPP